MQVYKTHLLLKDKKISSSEITETALKNAKASDSNAFISLTEDLALDMAKQRDQSISKHGPSTFVDGIPFTLKDLFITEGVRTTAGSKILYNYVPPYDGYVSASLKRDGGVLIGKVSCDQFGMGSTNENTPFGPVKNPLDPKCTSGGSSGGSAAAVKEESCAFSMGTDTGGSIRQPANFTGLVGFKPSYGRVSRYGQIAYGSSLDQSSPIAQTTIDIACVMESITDADERDATQAPLGSMNIVSKLAGQKADFLKGKKIGYAPELLDGCNPEVKSALDDALKIFKSQGAKLVEVKLPHLKYCVSAYYIIATSEASANLARFDGIHYGHRHFNKGNLEETYRKSRTEGFGDEVKRRILLGTFSLSSGYYDAYFSKACKVRRLIWDDFEKGLADCDMIFSPVSATTALKLGEMVNDPLQMYMNDLYTIPVNLAGLPGLALPFGKDSSGLPSGFQLIGRPFSDEEVLQFGHAFEQSRGQNG